jgi:hypothetical protein
MPTHIMAFIRDLIDKNIYANILIPDQHLTYLNSWCGKSETYNFYYCNIFAYNDYIDSNNVLYITKLSNIFINDKDIYDSTSGLNFIDSTDIQNLIKITIDCLNKYNYCNIFNFKVINRDFFAGDGHGSELCENFIKFAKDKYSFMKNFSSAFACEGGFTFDMHHNNDPLYYFAKKLPMYTSSKTDLRGNNDFHRHYSTNLWYLLILYYWLNEYGIETTDLVCEI